jgi:hypothetical protein
VSGDVAICSMGRRRQGLIAMHAGSLEAPSTKKGPRHLTPVPGSVRVAGARRPDTLDRRNSSFPYDDFLMQLMPVALALLCHLTVFSGQSFAMRQSFGSEQLLSTAAASAMSVSAADLDGDGDNDVLTTASGAVAWQENLLGGNFTPPRTIASWAPSYMVPSIPTDLDGDGDVDILLGDNSTSGVYWSANQGLGVFDAEQLITNAATHVEMVHAADLDGDGDKDVLYAGLVWNDIAWNENLGGGQFGPQMLISSSASLTTSIYTADVDGDGDLDVLTASLNDGEIAWIENLGSGAFGPFQIIHTLTGEGARSVHAADLDGDGDADVLTATPSNDRIAWFENDGTGMFGPEQLIVSSNVDQPTCVYAADLDGDGDFDVLSASTGDDKISWFENLGPGTFGAQQVISSNADGAVWVYASDLDGDGDAAVLSASIFDGKFAMYENLTIDDCNWNGIPDVDDIANGTSGDCNSNGEPDECDILFGVSVDCDLSGIPDECEFASLETQSYCLCGSGAPCGNTDPWAGCANYSGSGSLVTACGSSSVASDDLVLRAENIQPQQFGLFFMGTGQAQVPFGNGQLCVNAAGLGLFRFPVRNSGSSGVIAQGPGLLAHASSHFGVFGTPTAGQAWNFQCWFRDPLGPCGSTFNLSNGMTVTFVP